MTTARSRSALDDYGTSRPNSGTRDGPPRGRAGTTWRPGGSETATTIRSPPSRASLAPAELAASFGGSAWPPSSTSRRGPGSAQPAGACRLRRQSPPRVSFNHEASQRGHRRRPGAECSRQGSLEHHGAWILPSNLAIIDEAKQQPPQVDLLPCRREADEGVSCGQRAGESSVLPALR